MSKTRNFSLYIFLFFIAYTGTAQNVVQWSHTFNEKEGTVDIKADIQEGWHLYSQHVANDIGPVPTSFLFDENEEVKLIGKVYEPKPEREYDENFEAMLDFFKGSVIFQQRVSLKKSTSLTYTVTYMVCDDTMCLPPVDEKYTIELQAK
jgi:hypothetical protein